MINPPKPKKESGLFLKDEFVNSTDVHTNISQVVIVTTGDKLKLALFEYKRIEKIKSNWIPAVSLFMASITPLVAADFKNFLITKDVWNALFILLTVGSGIWSLYTTIRAISYIGINNDSEFIEKLKLTAIEGNR